MQLQIKTLCVLVYQMVFKNRSSVQMFGTSDMCGKSEFYKERPQIIIFFFYHNLHNRELL